MVPALPAIGADRLPKLFSCRGFAKVETFPFFSSIIFYHIFCPLAQNRGVGFRFAGCHSRFPRTPNIYPFNSSIVLKKAPMISGGRGWGLSFEVVSVGLVLNFDRQIRRLDIDSLGGLTNNTSNGIQHLACGLQLPLLNGLIK